MLVGVLLSLIFLLPRIRSMKTVNTGQVCSRFSGRLWRGFYGTFFHYLFLLSFNSSLLGLEPSQNPQCLASGPNKAQALRSHCKNSVRDTVIGKRRICLASERSTLHRVYFTEGKCRGHGMWCGYFLPVGQIRMLLSGRIFPTIGEPPTPLSFDSDLELSCHFWMCH